MRYVITSILLAAVTGNACASWTVINVNRDAGQTSHIELATVRHTGNMAKMWTMTDYAEPQPLINAAPYLSSVMLYEYDCKELRMRALSINSYSGNMSSGKTNWSLNTATEWEYVRPGTIGCLSLEAACKRTTRK